MRIVFLNPTGELGGAEVSLLSILASLRVAEPRWSLRLIVGSNGRFVSQAEALGACTRVVPFPPALARLGDAGSCDPGDRRLSRHPPASLMPVERDRKSTRLNSNHVRKSYAA